MIQKPNRLFSRVAAMLLMMVLTTATAWAQGVDYIDANGVVKNTATDDIVGNDNPTVLTSGGETTLSAGWYVVNSDITYTGTVTLGGDVTIILADGKTMNIGTSEDSPVTGNGIDGSDHNLTIYGQTLNEATAGQLSIYSISDGSASGYGIWLIDRAYTQHSGNVTIASAVKSALVSGNITINGGKLGATAFNDKFISSNVYALLGRNITMTGGVLTASGITDGNNSDGIYCTTFTLGWRNASDRFTASSFAGGTVTIASGKAFTDGTDIYSGTLSSDDLTAIAGKTLVPQTETFYQRVTDVSQLESGKRYFIVAKQSETYYAWARFNSDFVTTTEISANSSGIITSVGNAAHMQLVQSGEKWKIIDCSTNQYVGVKGGANKLQESSDSDSDSFLWNISFDGSGTLKVHIGEKYLKFIKNITLTAFSIYGESEQTDISIYKEVLIPGTSLTLYDGIDNTAMIGEAATIGGTFNVTLKNRVLYKDGKWNTLCLPFAVGEGEAASGHELDGTPLEGATLMTLGNSQGCNTGFDATTGTLNLEFLPAKTVEPGVPYIVKWDSGDNITNPEFTGVTVTNDAPADHATTSQDGYVIFVGTYSPTAIYADPAFNLYLGSGNTLYYPSSEKDVNAFRAYFQLNNGLTAGEPNNPNAVRAFNLNFGEDISTGVVLIDNGQLTMDNEAGAWYTLDGVRLNGKPTKKGLYIVNGKKVVVP